MLSDTDAGKRDTDVEEGEIGEDADAAVDEAAEGSGEKADLVSGTALGVPFNNREIPT
jgi:hypothetical protein